MATNPLPEGTLAEIKEALVRLDEAQQQADQATRAGIDVREQIAQIRDTRDRLNKIRQVYYPGQ